MHMTADSSAVPPMSMKTLEKMPVGLRALRAATLRPSATSKRMWG
jgi:hypothetical protein